MQGGFYPGQKNSRFWIGSNYWPGVSGIKMWSQWDSDDIRKDLEKMIDLGLNVHRAFLFLPDFLPNPPAPSPVMEDRLLLYLDLCEEIGIGTLLTLLGTHMSGQNWEVNWRQGRNFYTDPELLLIQERFIHDIVKIAKSSKALAGWVLSNEIPNYEPRGTSDEVAAWAKRLIETIHFEDPDHPVTIGDGCWAPEINHRKPNFPLRKLAPLQDFLGLHFYPRSGNPWRQSFTAAFRLQMAAAFGKPVLVEEFGHSVTMGSEVNQGHYYRTVLYSSLVNGACGVLNWCFADFDLPHSPPYNHHPFEMRFGLVRSDGSIRPAGIEVQQFSAFCHDLTDQNCRTVERPRVGLVIPASYYVENPFDWDTDFKDWYPLYLETFALLKRANLQVQCLFEPPVAGQPGHSMDSEVRLDPLITPLLVLPRLKRITAPFWKKLLQYVEEGGVLYASFAQDAWIVDWENTFGVTSDVRFGLPAIPGTGSLTFSVVNDWSHLQAGAQCNLPVEDRSTEMAYCPLLGCSAEELLVDDKNNPVLVRKAYGKGWLYFALFPVEMMLLKAGDHPAGEFWGQVYQAIWRLTGDHSGISINGQDLEWNIWEDEQSNNIKVVAVNHAWAARHGVLQIPDNHNLSISANVEMKDQGEGELSFELDKKGVLTASISKSGANGKTGRPKIGEPEKQRGVETDSRPLP